MNKEFKYYGRTIVCYLYDKYTDRIFKGVSVCSPKDQYDQKIGEEIARLKALHKLQVYKAKMYSCILDDIEYMKSIEDETRNQYAIMMAKTEKTFNRLTEIINNLQHE